MTDSHAIPTKHDSSQRIASLDLMRGVAVLGILVMNMAAFVSPFIATETPWLPYPASPADEWTFAALFVLFEGKMRGLFSILFGASMLLFIEKADQHGKNGGTLQLRRLLWLLLFGYLHFLLFWLGDILFLYAAVGMIALALRHLPPRSTLIFGIIFYVVWNVMGIVHFAPLALAEEHIRNGTASAADVKLSATALAETLKEMNHEITVGQGGFFHAISDKIHHSALRPFYMVVFVIGETLPLMLIGMALFRSGFFSGSWTHHTLKRMASLGILIGGALTLAIVFWAMPRHFPPNLPNNLSGLPRLMMTLGYAAALMLATPRLLASRIGQRLAAAGRMAFSNYLGTTLLMTFIFNGWGLGLFNTVPPHQQLWFTLLGWTLMLAWSKPWLAYFHQGPLEWLWRSLTEWRMMPMRRYKKPPPL